MPSTCRRRRLQQRTNHRSKNLSCRAKRSISAVDLTANLNSVRKFFGGASEWQNFSAADIHGASWATLPTWCDMAALCALQISHFELRIENGELKIENEGCDAVTSNAEIPKTGLTFPLRGRGTTKWWMRCIHSTHFNANRTHSAASALRRPPHKSAAPPASPHRRSLTVIFIFIVFPLLLRYSLHPRSVGGGAPYSALLLLLPQSAAG